MRTMRLPLLLVALAACLQSMQRAERGDRGEREEGGDRVERLNGTANLVSGEPVLVRSLAGAAGHGRTDTLSWTDSITRGDTTLVTRSRVISTTQVLTDSQWVHIAFPIVPAGIPFGLFGGWDGTALRFGSQLFTMTYGAESPATLLTRIATARSLGLKMVTTMTGGARANYLTGGVFDMKKWKARMDGFNTPEIRWAVARAVSEGVLVGNSVMDEPFNTGGPGNEANSWGPAGTMTKARVDSMCGYAKAVFPTLPQGVFHDYRLSSDSSYRVCDFVTTQYRTAKGSLTDYRDGALALCRRDRHACAFAINILDGGTPVKRSPGQTDYAPGDCPLTTTGGRGTYFPNCRMTAQQLRDAGRTLGPAGCFLTGFRYDSAFMASPANQQALRDILTALAAKPSTACVRG